MADDSYYSGHVVNIVQKARRLVGTSMRAISSRNPAFLLSVFLTYIKQTLNYASQIWNSGRRRDANLIESVQRRFTKRMTGMRNLSYINRLTTLDILSLEATRLQCDLITAYQITHGLMGISPENAGLQLSTNATRGGGLKLHQKFVKKSSVAAMFCFRIPTIWNSLPSHIIECKSLPAFKSSLKLYLRDLDSLLF